MNNKDTERTLKYLSTELEKIKNSPFTNKSTRLYDGEKTWIYALDKIEMVSIPTLSYIGLFSYGENGEISRVLEYDTRNEKKDSEKVIFDRRFKDFKLSEYTICTPEGQIKEKQFFNNRGEKNFIIRYLKKGKEVSFYKKGELALRKMLYSNGTEAVLFSKEKENPSPEMKEKTLNKTTEISVIKKIKQPFTRIVRKILLARYSEKERER